VLVTIVAPGSLTTWDGTAQPSNTTVPVLKLGVPISNDTNAEIASLWHGRFELLSRSTPVDVWEPSSACKVDCSFDVEFFAPSISCRPAENSEITLTPFNSSTESWVFFNSTLSPQDTEGSAYPIIWNRPYPSLSIDYIPMESHLVGNASISPSSGLPSPLAVNQTGPIAGVRCKWSDAKFKSTFSVAQHVKRITTSTVSPSINPAEMGCGETLSREDSSECGIYA
jgi:hypothetical protein